MGLLTRDEAEEIIQYLHLYRPTWPKATEDMTFIINEWFKVFGAYESVIVRYAAERFIKTNPGEPKIADIYAEIEKIITAEDETTVEEAIAESWEAIKGDKKFSELSELSREYWGRQSVIDALGYDENTNYEVVAGQMRRRLPAIKERLRVRRETPPEIREAVAKLIKNKGVDVKELLESGAVDGDR